MGKITFFVCVALAFGANAATYGAEGIPVAFADADETPPATVFTRAVATVPSDQANAVKGMLRMPRPWKSYDSTLSVRDNGNNTSTILATYRPSGMTVIIR